MLFCVPNNRGNNCKNDLNIKTIDYRILGGF
jgi:hypothetical protein